ncbi:MAG TPA: zf-HC2 domain-containing protein [Actinomycetota bacterium]
MNCLIVREQLPEFALGVLSPEERAGLERHLAWCAGCRKEAGELGGAAATFAFTLPQAEPPVGLADRIVTAIRQTAGAPGTRRRLRTVAAATVAAMVAVAGLGWGAVMAGRAERFADRAALAQQQKVDDLERFRRALALRGLGSGLPVDQTYLGQLAPVSASHVGGGAALQLVSPRKFDFVMVIVNGLDRSLAGLPYQVLVRNADGQTLKAGRITALDKDGGAEVFHEFTDKDLSGFTTVLVTDAAGRVVLRGTVDQSSGSA